MDTQLKESDCHGPKKNLIDEIAVQMMHEPAPQLLQKIKALPDLDGADPAIKNNCGISAWDRFEANPDIIRLFEEYRSK